MSGSKMVVYLVLLALGLLVAGGSYFIPKRRVP